MFQKLKPLILSAVSGGGAIGYVQIANEILQTVTLACSTVLAVYGVIQLFRKRKK